MKVLQFTPPVIAHRGASALAPENTIAAFSQAAVAGAHWIEFDVMLAKCGEAIVFHDDTLERTTNGTGNILDHTYDSLRSYDAGSWFNPKFSGERIPLLKDVLVLSQTYQLAMNIELKPLPGQEQSLVSCVWDVVQQFKKNYSFNENNIIFSSFSLETLHYLRKLVPSAQIGLLLESWQNDWQDQCKVLKCVSLHIDEKNMSRDDVRQVKFLDMACLCYTVNSTKRAAKLYGYGVDAIFTDVPDKIIASL